MPGARRHVLPDGGEVHVRNVLGPAELLRAEIWREIWSVALGAISTKIRKKLTQDMDRSSCTLRAHEPAIY